MLTNKDVSRLSGLPCATIRQLVHRRIILPTGENGRWTKGQALGLCAMKHARLAGATMSAAVGVYEILKAANWDALRAACDDGKQYLRIMGEHVETQLVSHVAAFDRRLIVAATEKQIPFVVVDVLFWLNRVELAERERMAERRLEKQPA